MHGLGIREYNKKKKQTHRYREQTSGYQWGEIAGRVNIGVGTEHRPQYFSADHFYIDLVLQKH